MNARYQPIVLAEAAERRAWVEAARCWQEFRAAPARTPDEKAVRGLLLAGAQEAEGYWRRLHKERLDLEEALAWHVSEAPGRPRTAVE